MIEILFFFVVEKLSETQYAVKFQYNFFSPKWKIRLKDSKHNAPKNLQGAPQELKKS